MDDLDLALSTLTDAKVAQSKLAYALSVIERLRHRKPVEVIQEKASPQKTPEDWIRVIIPDLHGNHMCRPAVAAMIRDIKQIEPDEIVLLGDVLDCGGFLAEHQVIGYVAEAAGCSYEQDVLAANQFLDRLTLAAPGARIHWLEGNHDSRVEKWCVTRSLRQAVDADFLLSLVGPQAVCRLAERGVQYYRLSERYDDLPVPGTIRLGNCLFTHGFSAGRFVSADHALKAGTNIVFGHAHRSQSAVLKTIRDGIHGAWCPGCMCQLQKYYEHSTPNDHSHGYAIQVVAKSGKFLHLQIPIWDGDSLLPSISFRGTAQ